MTLSEFANELRKIFKFDCLTVECIDSCINFCIWEGKPYFDGIGRVWTIRGCSEAFLLDSFWSFLFTNEIDLSEYADANGNIDYSKCIVEVEDE